jgi:hypothetical protein
MPITEQPYSFRPEKTVLTECFSSRLKRFVFLFQKSRFRKEKDLLAKAVWFNDQTQSKHS